MLCLFSVSRVDDFSETRHQISYLEPTQNHLGTPTGEVKSSRAARGKGADFWETPLVL